MVNQQIQRISANIHRGGTARESKSNHVDLIQAGLDRLNQVGDLNQLDSTLSKSNQC